MFSISKSSQIKRSLSHLLKQWITIPDQQNWLTKLLEYDFEIIYKVGTLNGVVDVLSRIHEDGTSL